jgi:hypothetical protein
VSVTQPVNNPRAQRGREGSGVRFMAPCSSPLWRGRDSRTGSCPRCSDPKGTREDQASRRPLPARWRTHSARKGSRWRPLPGVASAGCCRDTWAPHSCASLKTPAFTTLRPWRWRTDGVLSVPSLCLLSVHLSSVFPRARPAQLSLCPGFVDGATDLGKGRSPDAPPLTSGLRKEYYAAASENGLLSWRVRGSQSTAAAP